MTGAGLEGLMLSDMINSHSVIHHLWPLPAR